MRSKSLSRCKTVSPASSAVAAMMSSGMEGARYLPLPANASWTSSARSSMRGVRYSTGIATTTSSERSGVSEIRERAGYALPAHSGDPRERPLARLALIAAIQFETPDAVS